MDLRPGFGPQELMETLSQSSSGTGKSGGEPKSTNSSVNKKDSIGASRNNHHQMLMAGDSHVYEAVRKLGRRLSIQAHGGIENIHDEWKKTVKLQRSTQSGFYSYRNDADQNKDERRKNKVLKTRYSDHGEHDSNLQSSHGSCHRHLVRRITFECKDRFRKWEEEEITRREQQNHQQEDPSKLSPQQYSLSKLTLESHSALAPQSVTGDLPAPASGLYNPPGGNVHNLHRRPSNGCIGLGISIDEESALDRWTQRGSGFHGGMGLIAERTAHHGGKGFLAAVMEGASDSNASGYPGADSPASQSISTKDSKTSLKSQKSGSASSSRAAEPPLPRGKCLTTPSEPVENGGLDNIEGNLIVHENDSIVVPRKNIRTVRKDKESRIRSAEFRVQKLQGQGTFAQVFQCVHVQTGQNVALKIIKNKPAYTRQAAIEIDIFQTLQDDDKHQNTTTEGELDGGTNRDYMVNLISYFMHQNHLCLVFELLGMNLYEVLKKRSFFGLPLAVVRDIVQQAVEGVRDLSQKNVVHCDLKPENMLLVSEEDDEKLLNANEQKSSVKSHDNRSSDTLFADSSGGTPASGSSKTTSQASSNAMTIQAANLLPQSSSCKIKLIDFGSACFEGYTAHTYIQSRFYRSPEVLIGLPYDSAIDMWSLGCVAAELFLGLPILPGVHEHEQLCRIIDMIGKVPDWMLEQGSKTTKYFTKYVPRSDKHSSPGAVVFEHTNSTTRKTTGSPATPAPPLPRWRIKTQEEYVSSLTESEICKKGGLAKLNKPPGNRYFKRQKLSDILILHAQKITGEDRRLVPAFVHFLYGILDPDPWKRLTALQAAQHPFVTGNLSQLRVRTNDTKLNPKEENQANLELEVYWPSPWDPAVCRRKLLNVQKIREKQQALRRNVTPRPISASRSSPMVGTASLASVDESRRGTGNSPPSLLPSSHSNSTLHANYSASASRDGAPSSSWIDHASASQNGHHSAAINANRSNQAFSRFLDASSVQSVQTSGLTSTETDFAQALQRPGVFPGHGFASSLTPMDSPATFQQNGMQMTSQNSVQPAPPYGPSFPQYSNIQQFASPMSSQMLSMTNQPMVTPLARVSSTSFVSQDQSVPSGYPLAHPNSPSAMSVASSVTMQDISYVDPQQLAIMQLQQQQQQQQLAFQQFGLLHQPLQQQQQVMHQQAYANQYAPQVSFQPPPQQHQQAILLAGAQGGGYYYVTTSAGGQPILLQPVGMLNHTGGQPMLNQTPSLVPLNQQMYVPQMSSFPAMPVPGNVAYAQTNGLNNNMFVDMQPGFNPPVQSQPPQPPQTPRQQQGSRKNFNGHVQYPRGSSM
jgi:serine/threonine protein kinase